ncbi:MAG: DHA2 family efflux MFS transporter permease subunit [Peptococcales bacterium]|jgi:EmrB/QacA subfamily drug resistance transporter
MKNNVGYLEDVKKQRALLAAVMVAGITTMLNNTTVTIALPSFIEIFHTNIRMVQWVVVGYMLALGMVMPLASYFGERYSYRKLFITGLGAMGLCSLACAGAQGLYSLIVFRMLQGAAAGVIVPCTMSLLYRHIPKEKQAHYLGITVMTHSLGIAVGPSIAGMLLQFLSWHFLFLVNVPLIILAVYLSWHSLPVEPGRKTKSLDFIGILMVTVGTGLVLIGFTNVEVWGATNIKFISCCVTGFLLILLFIIRETKSEEPLLNFTVLKYRPFVIALLINCTMSMTISITGILVAVYIQTIRGYSPMEAGLILLLPSVVLVIGNMVSDRLFGKISSRMLVFVGLLIATLGNYSMSLAGLNTGVVAIVFFMCLRYFGMGMVKMPLTDYGLGNVPSYLSGHASSMFNWGRQIVTVMATNILTVILSIDISRYYARAGFRGEIVEGTESYAIAAIQAVQDNFFYLAVIIFGSALLALLMDKNPSMIQKLKPKAVEN